MPVYTENFAELLEPGIKTVYGDEYEAHPEEYSQVYSIETATKAEEHDLAISSMGNAVEKNEGQAVTYDTIYQGYKKTYSMLTYALGIAISREMYEDDQYRKMNGLAKGLAKSVRETVEILGAATFNNAFNATYTGSDGLELCSTLHTTFGGGGTYRNELSVAADLDVTSYEAALIDIGTQFIDDRGKKVPARPKKLIVHPSNYYNALVILKSAQLPGVANNDYNPVQNSMPGGIVSLHWLTDEDAWFISTDIPNGLRYFWRRRPDFTRDNDFDTENAKFKTTFRCGMGWTDPRGIFGSPGA